MNSFDINKVEAIKLYRCGKYVKAIKYFTDALFVQPLNAECLIKRSNCYLQDGQIEKALIDAHLAVKNYPKNQKAVYQLGEVYYIKGEFEKSLLLYHNGMQLRPDDEKFRLGIQRSEAAIGNCLGKGSSFHINGDEEDSSEEDSEMETLVTNKSETQLKSVKIIKELLHELCYDRFYLEHIVKDEEARMHKFKEINPKEHEKKKCRFIKNAIMEYYNRSAFKRNFCSINIHRVAQHCINYLDPRADFWQQHQPFYSRPGHRRKLKTKCSSASKEKSKWTAHNVLLELVHIEMLGFQRDYHQAVEKAKDIVNILEEVKGIDGQNLRIILSDLYSIIGNSCFKMGNYKEALKYHELDRNNGIAYNIKDAVSRSLDYLGIIHFIQNEFEMAIKIWKSKIELAVSNLELSWLNHEIGRAYMAMDNYEMSLNYATQSLEKATLGMDENWQMNAHILIGKALYNLNRISESVDMYKKASDLSKILKLNGVEEEIHKLVQHVILKPRIADRTSVPKFRESVKLSFLKDYHSKSSVCDTLSKSVEKPYSVKLITDDQTVASLSTDEQDIEVKSNEDKQETMTTTKENNTRTSIIISKNDKGALRRGSVTRESILKGNTYKESISKITLSKGIMPTYSNDDDT